MSRTPDERRRAELLDRTVDYICAHGVAELSLRPLAKAVDSSPRVLLHYFGSKEALVVEALSSVGERHRALFASMIQRRPGAIDTCREIWNAMSSPESIALFHVWFEIYGLAMQARSRYAAFLERIIAPWLAFIGDPLVQSGAKREYADAYATMVVAAFRGFLLDLCATGDRERVDRAVTMWLESLSVFIVKEMAS